MTREQKEIWDWLEKRATTSGIDFLIDFEGLKKKLGLPNIHSMLVELKEMKEKKK